ncbi:DUF2867 domain-containing protein [soil metagenome]
MHTAIKAITIPRNSKIAGQLDGAYFADCYPLALNQDAPSALEIYLNLVAATPMWVNTLMALRNRAVALVGLKNLGHLGTLSKAKPASAYRVGDRVGIFSLLYVSENEIVLGETDKHLDVKLSLYKLPPDASRQTSAETWADTSAVHCKNGFAAITTVVHIHNTLGRLYMFFVGPVHKIIVPAMLSKGSKPSIQVIR